MPVKNRVAEMQGEVAEWRRDLHANPELMYDTHRTAKTVAEKLRAFGLRLAISGIGRRRPNRFTAAPLFRTSVMVESMNLRTPA